MKKMFVVMVIMFGPFLCAFAQDGTNDPLSRIKVLGVSPLGNASTENSLSWNSPMVVTAYAVESATPTELMQFLKNKKNIGMCTNSFGQRFCFLAVDPKEIMLVVEKSFYAGGDYSMYWADGIHLLLKEKE
jgi:hypothetical protein